MMRPFCRLSSSLLRSRSHSHGGLLQPPRICGRGLSSEALQTADLSPDDEQWCFRPKKESPAVARVAVRGPQWIFLGCPGVGKGTYASRLAKHVGIPHIAMGDLVREELSQATASGDMLKKLMNEGKLLPDDVILELLARRLEKGASMGESGFILDGFPRTQSQAETLEKVAVIDLVVNLRLQEDILITKCLGRRICSGCGTSYNIAKIDVESEDGKSRIFMPPLLPPPACATKLTVRADDTEEVVRARLQVYAEESKPVEEFYSVRDKLLNFNVIGGIPETWPKLLDALKEHLPEQLQSAAV